jgi:hypothetical protein
VPANDKACTSAAFRTICEEVRATCPPPKGTSVVFRRVPSKRIDGMFGNTTLKGRRFLIEVRSDLTQQETEDTTLHEYAHVMSWRPYHPVTSDHDATWGVAFAQVYRAYNGAT